VLVLRHFPSDANVARLKALLADPGFVLSGPAPGGKERKFYIVRKSAYEALVAWGLKPEQPEFYKESSELPGDARDQKTRDRESGVRQAAPNEPHAANSRPDSQGRSERLGMAAIADSGRSLKESRPV
jgi:hypothetical protein